MDYYNKKYIREQMKYQLKTYSQEEKYQADMILTNMLLNHPVYKKCRTIATFISMEIEFSTINLINSALADGKKVVVPKISHNGKMIFVSYNANQLIKSSFGIWEPISDVEVQKKEIDLIHVPGLAWNSDGFRIGFGAGYYDKYLSDFKGNTLSTCYDFQCQEFVPEQFDIPVEEVLIFEKNI